MRRLVPGIRVGHSGTTRAPQLWSPVVLQCRIHFDRYYRQLESSVGLGTLYSAALLAALMTRGRSGHKVVHRTLPDSLLLRHTSRLGERRGREKETGENSDYDNGHAACGWVMEAE